MERVPREAKMTIRMLRWSTFNKAERPLMLILMLQRASCEEGYGRWAHDTRMLYAVEWSEGTGGKAEDVDVGR